MMQSSKHLSVSSKMKRIIVKKGITGYSVADCYKNRMRFQGQKSAKTAKMPDSKQGKSAKLIIFGKNAKFRGRPSVKLGKNGKNAKFGPAPRGQRK
jgi:hypothetical protein